MHACFSHHIKLASFQTLGCSYETFSSRGYGQHVSPHDAHHSSMLAVDTRQQMSIVLMCADNKLWADRPCLLQRQQNPAKAADHLENKIKSPTNARKRAEVQSYRAAEAVQRGHTEGATAAMRAAAPFLETSPRLMIFPCRATSS